MAAAPAARLRPSPRLGLPGGESRTRSECAMELSHFPRSAIAFLPTPIHALPRLSAQLGGPNLWTKRDDQTGLAFGGNKVRKLEFLLGEAIARAADTLITSGAPQSNHARQTAAAAARAGLKCALVLRGDAPAEIVGNILLDRLLGADIVWAGARPLPVVVDEVADELRARGQRPFVIPLGGSNAAGALGYVVAMREFVEQSRSGGIDFDAVIFATSSGGTQAGMAVGARMTGYTGRRVGISVDHRADEFKQTLVPLANATAERLGLSTSFAADDFEVRDEYLGGGYGVMGEPEREAIAMAAQAEGLLVDPVYTGRALAGLIDLIRNGEFKAGQNVLFWHTGGTPALFAYARQLIG